MQVFEALAGDDGAGIGDGALGIRPPPSGILPASSRASARQPKAPPAMDEDFAPSVARADLFAAGGGNLERHADLIGGEERGVGSELAEWPRAAR